MHTRRTIAATIGSAFAISLAGCSGDTESAETQNGGKSESCDHPNNFTDKFCETEAFMNDLASQVETNDTPYVIRHGVPTMEAEGQTEDAVVGMIFIQTGRLKTTFGEDVGNVQNALATMMRRTDYDNTEKVIVSTYEDQEGEEFLTELVIETWWIEDYNDNSMSAEELSRRVFETADPPVPQITETL